MGAKDQGPRVEQKGRDLQYRGVVSVVRRVHCEKMPVPVPLSYPAIEASQDPNLGTPRLLDLLLLNHGSL